MIEKQPHHAESDYWQYFCSMDAITACTGREARKPGRITDNCMEMLAAKTRQIADSELRSDAFGALRALADMRRKSA